MIEKLEIGQGGSSDFSAGTRDIARGKDRSEDGKYEVKLTLTKTNFSITSGIESFLTKYLCLEETLVHENELVS